MPTTTSAPHSPGGASSVSASRSAAHDDQAAARVHGVGERAVVAHVAVGARILQQHARTRRVARIGRADDDLDAERLRARAHDVDASAAARRRRRRTRCSSTTDAQRSSVIASAAAVASSSIDALAIAMPVRSETIVWKLTSASSRPCEISGWYGVYAVYHAGFSRTLRRITGGVCVP